MNWDSNIYFMKLFKVGFLTETKPTVVLLLHQTGALHKHHLGICRKNVESQAPPSLLSQNLNFNKIPRGFIHTLKFGKHCTAVPYNSGFTPLGSF